jgi:membrane associated rhomboid family serine protease
MGIYDREYVRVGPRSGSGLGSLRFVSINSWIIIINVAVFALGIVLSRTASPVLVREHLQTVPASGWVEEPVFRRLVARGQGVVTTEPVDVRGAPAGSEAGRLLYDKASMRQVGGRIFGQPVGMRDYQWMNPLDKWGHMSTHFLVGRPTDSPKGTWPNLQVWRVITFQFLHANITHIFFNMFGLWVFGGMVEQYLGSRRYAAFYLTCGVFGALSYLLLNALGASGVRLPAVLVEDEHTPLVGASAGVFGVIVAAAYIAPNAMVQLLFPPIPIKLKVMAYAYVALAAFNLLRGGQNAGGDAAHIGGAIAGFFLVRNAHLLWDFFDIFKDSRRARAGGAGRPRDADAAEVDRILAKVRSGGLRSLSDGERRALRRASERQNRG